MHKQIKLQPKHRSLTYGQKVVPELKLSGVWLEQIGFNPGQTVMVTIEEEKITIEPFYAEASTDKPVYVETSADKPIN